MRELGDIRGPVNEGDMERVEDALAAATSFDDPFLSEIAGHLVRAGGKRIRPTLVLGACLACGSEIGDRAIQGAVAVELVHQGSLYHDDVIDEAEQRHAGQSVNTRWGNLVAILGGDFLLATASEIAASLGSGIAELLAATIARMCQGELSQLQYAFRADRPESSYLDAISGKTASLMSAACRIGATAAGAGSDVVQAASEFGEAYGMAFQICDDVRDLLDTPDRMGKPAGHDMVEGTYTLPVLRALRLPEVGGELKDLLGRTLDEPGRNKARDLILGSGAVEQAVSEGRRWVERGAQALETLKPTGDALVIGGLSNMGFALFDGMLEE